MNESLEEVLHKRNSGLKLIQSKSIKNVDQSIESPSIQSSFSEERRINYDDLIFSACNKWILADEQYDQTYNTSFKKKLVFKIKYLIKIVFMIIFVLQMTFTIFNLLLSFILPLLQSLLNENLIFQNIPEYLLFYLLIHSCLIIFFESLIYYADIIKDYSIKYSNIYINIYLIILIIINLSVESIYLQIFTFTYFFKTALNKIEICYISLFIITKNQKTYFNHFKIILEYLYIINLFSCYEKIICSEFENHNYWHYFIKNIKLITFQYINDEFQQEEYVFLIIQSIAPLLLLMKTIYIIHKIQLKNNKQSISKAILLFQFCILYHKIDIQQKIKIFLKYRNNRFKLLIKNQQKEVNELIYFILQTYTDEFLIFSEQCLCLLAQNAQIITKKSEYLEIQSQIGFCLFLKGMPKQLNSNNQQQNNITNRAYGLINCFLEEQYDTINCNLELINKNILFLFINIESFQLSIKNQIDFERFSLIKYKLQFNGDTDYFNLKCDMCGQFHLLQFCTVIKKQFQNNVIQINNISNYRKFFTRKKRNKLNAKIIFSLKMKKSSSIQFNVSDEIESSSSSSYILDNETQNQHSSNIIDLNILNLNSKGNIFKDHGDFISDKNILEQLKSNTKVMINVQSAMMGSKEIKSDFRSFNQANFQSLKFNEQSSLQQFNTLLLVDKAHEYDIFYPEYNLSQVIEKVNKQQILNNK